MAETKQGAGRPAAPAEEDPNATVVCSSPPCFMHELDPTYLGYLGREEVSALLGALLAAEWGGAVPDEACLRAALRRRLEEQGSRPDHAPGTSRDAASGDSSASGEPPERVPDRLARTVRDALPRLYDDALRRDLEAVLGVLERGTPPREALPSGS